MLQRRKAFSGGILHTVIEDNQSYFWGRSAPVLDAVLGRGTPKPCM
jgi:hypothetical protein